MSHPAHCDCAGCAFRERIARDEAQSQTLQLYDDLDRIRQRLRLLQRAVDDEVSAIDLWIAQRIGPSAEGSPNQHGNSGGDYSIGNRRAHGTRNGNGEEGPHVESETDQNQTESDSGQKERFRGHGQGTAAQDSE